jgi:hypothetical protein
MKLLPRSYRAVVFPLRRSGARAKLHQAEMLTKALQEAVQQATDGKTDGKASSKPSSAGSQRAPGPPVVLDNVLGQELVSARVQEDAALRRAELVEKERDRVQLSLADMQVGASMGWSSLPTR